MLRSRVFAAPAGNHFIVDTRGPEIELTSQGLLGNAYNSRFGPYLDEEMHPDRPKAGLEARTELYRPAAKLPVLRQSGGVQCFA